MNTTNPNKLIKYLLQIDLKVKKNIKAQEKRTKFLNIYI